jgi:hypothetical protein
MPNYCNNVISITGDKEKIREILKKIGETPTSLDAKLFETLIGTDTDKTKGWYESNLTRYGTKWDVNPDDSNIEFSDDMITMNLDTAWSPPVQFCITLAKEYGVQVEIKFFEPGCDFAGRSVINEVGEIVEEEDYNYDEGMYILDSEGFWSDRENDYMDEETLDGSSLEDYVTTKYSYVDEDGRTKIIGYLTEALKNNDEEDNSGE